MGRGGFKRNRGRGGRRDNQRSNGGRSYHQRTYPDIVKENALLQTYYNGLLQLEDNEAEREALWAAFRRELPHSFRFCGSKGHALAVQKLLQTRYIPELAKMTHYDGLPVSPPQPVPWYPDNLAWWMTTSKTVIRKFPPFAAFQKFLVSETTVGNISRQEVVSMIPPLLLDVRPGMAVLDLCAAPGSKAAQLLEMVHHGEEARVRRVLRAIEKGLGGREAERAAVEAAEADDKEEDPAARLAADPSDDGRATGVLIANDADYKRSHLLIHQLKRLSSPNIIVTNHDATIYPSLRLPPLPAAEGSKKPAPVRYLKFDRILADVPCSGDGTLRKNVNMWKDWSPGSALGLHLTQVRILVRALQMLKPGGRVVYSTCSLNPVENESVIAAAVDLCGGSARVAILDSSDHLPQLQRRPGLKSWRVMDKSGRQWSSWAEVEAYVASDESAGVPPSRLVPSMFANEASDRLPLERCLRVYPHLQDTGGFFIVVLEKKAEFKVKWDKKEAAKAPAVAKKTGEAEVAVAESVAESVAEPVAEPEAEPEAEPTITTSSAAAKRPAEDEAEAGSQSPKKQRTSDHDAGKAAPEAAPETAPETALETAEDVEMTDVKTTKGDEAEQHKAPPAEEKDDEIDDTTSRGPRRKLEGPYEELFKYLPADHAVVAQIRDFYGLSPRFPMDRFMVRNAYGEPAKGIYYTSELVRDILASNTSDGSRPQQHQQSRVKFVHGGVRMFVRQEAPSAEVCRWRIQSEGMPLLQGYVGEDRVVRLWRKATLRALLVEMFPKFADGGAEKLGEVGTRLPEIGMGCFVLKVEPGREKEEDGQDGQDSQDGDTGVPLEATALPLWKSFQSLNLMLPKEDRAAMLLRIFNDTTPLVNNALHKKGADASPSTEAAAAAAATPAETTTTETATETAAATPPVPAPIDEQEAYDAEDAPSS